MASIEAGKVIMNIELFVVRGVLYKTLEQNIEIIIS
jgi:archaellum component FlaF (FlaF/FlaG flagellin family)